MLPSPTVNQLEKFTDIVYGGSSGICHSEKLKAREVTQPSRQAKMEGVQDFLKEPAPEKKLWLLRKRELIEIEEKLELGVKRSLRKNEVIRIVMELMID